MQTLLTEATDVLNMDRVALRREVVRLPRPVAGLAQLAHRSVRAALALLDLLALRLRHAALGPSLSLSCHWELSGWLRFIVIAQDSQDAYRWPR